MNLGLTLLKDYTQKRPIINEIWEHIIFENNIDLSKDFSTITSKDIKKSKCTWKGKDNQFEPRLICKMDTNKSRPQCFKDNNISIISIKNGVYALIKADLYIPLPVYYGVPKIIINNVNSLIMDIGDSETSMLNKLLYNGVFDNIIGEKIIFNSLLGGRHRCNFCTFINGKQIEISGSQYETDACYETDNFVCVVEAKSIECIDFNVRQLYLPVREIYKKIKNDKQIISLFIYKDKQNIIHIYKYKWNNIYNMLDIINIGYYRYYYQL